MKGSPPAVTGKDKPGSVYRFRSGELQKQFLANNGGVELIHGRSDAVDELVLSAYRRFLSPALDSPAGFCLAAIGGYGRRELFPHSDVDLLLLFARQIGQGVARDQISCFLRDLWDAGLRVGHTVRLLSECSALDPANVEFSVSLLDGRFLAGDPGLYERLEHEAVPRLVSREQTALIKNLTALAELRHHKHGETIYHLEPDVKESPGGLRDYQLAGWVARILRADKALPSREDVPEMARQETVGAFQFLVGARAHAHLLAGRDNNTLTFDLQAQIAARFRGPDGPAPSAEEWMRAYFRNARNVYRLADRMVRHAAPPRSVLSQWFQQRQERVSNADFAVHGGEIFLRNPVAAQRNPVVWLDLFELAARRGLPLSLETERRLERQLSELQEWACGDASELWTRFRRILVLPHAYLALSAMHELGLLGALFPEFALIDSLVIRDLYHKYTVDEHSLIAIKHLHELSEQKQAAETEAAAPPRFAGVWAELDQPELLLFALLLHDLGKSAPGNHVDESVRLGKAILARLRLDPREAAEILFLIENHLVMSGVMTSRDMSEPATVKDFAARVGTAERLKMLALLTYADIRSVNPGALPAWKEENLWQIYVATHNELNRQLDTDRATPAEASVVFRAEVAEFVAGFPRRYLKRHSAPEVLTHHRLAQELEREPVQLVLDRRRGYYDLLVLTRDHPFLFAAITGTLAASGMNIVKAEAFSNRRGVVLDAFRFVDLHRTIEQNPEENQRLQERLRDAITGKTDVGKLIEGRLKRVPLGRSTFTVETRLRFDNAASPGATLVEIVTRDRPGLLYTISTVLSAHGCNIEVVLVDTQGQKAIDVFYVTKRGAPLETEWQQAIGQELRRVLE